MFITIEETEYELKTTLGVAERLETKFKLPLMDMLGHVEVATIPELISMIAISANMTGDAKLPEQIKDNMDYVDLQTVVQELLARIMFSGTPEAIEKKLDKFPAGEESKNVIRGLLGLTKVKQTIPLTGNA